jgi:hypothetical protein
MRCGAASSCVVQKTFMSTPRVPGAVRIRALLSGDQDQLAAVAKHRSIVPVPLCDKCQSHWKRYRWLAGGVVFGFVLLIALLVAWIQWTWGSLLELRNQRAVEILLLGLLGIATLVVGAAALIRPPIRAKEITEQTIILTGVSDRFPGAVRPRAWWPWSKKSR